MRRVLMAIVVAVVAVGGYLLFRGGGADAYTVRMKLPNAGGLRDGSPVVVGGVQVGKVSLEAHFDAVEIKLDIDEKHAPIGRDATGAIVAQNVLGQKQVRLTVGDKEGDPAPEDYVLPTAQVRTSTDLDQLLSTLDADTRTRLAVLVNELGAGFAGRELDFRTFLTDFRPALDAGGTMLEQLTRDNRALGNLIELSDSYVGELTRARADLSRAIDSFGRATETVATRRAELRETLRRAPAALVAARGFLSELRQTTGPLQSTARLLTQTAPSVRTVLERIGPLTQAAEPTLDALREHSAPALVALGDVSTPRADALLPTLETAADLVETEVPPVGDTLERSVDNLLATVENWSRAIQFRDGLGHIFRGEASFSPQMYNRIITALGGNARRAPRPAVAPKRQAPEQTAPAPAAPRPQTPARPKPITQQALENVLGNLDKTTKDVQKLVDALVKKPLLPGMQPLLEQQPSGEATVPLLDYLLGR